VSEVKRYWERKALINHDFIDKPYGDERNRCLNISETGWTEYVLASDHDYVVAELNRRIERLESALQNVRSDLCWLMDRHDLPMMLNDTLIGVCNALEGDK